MKRFVGLGLLASGILLQFVFVTWRGRLAALWLAGAGLALLLSWLRPEWVRRVWYGWALGLAGLLALAPSSPPSGSPVGTVALFWLRFSPFNLVPERDLSSLGLALIYPGAPGQAIHRLTDPLYDQMDSSYSQLASGVHFTATDIFGLGTGSGHLYNYAPPGERPLLLFLHGALGNLQCYLYNWQLYAEPRSLAVVCPTFGFGSWFRKRGVETAAAAWDYTQEHLSVQRGAALVIGHSNGATGALRLACAHPEMVSGLVLISPVLEVEVIRSPAFLDWARRHPPPLTLMGDADVNVSPVSVARGVEEMKAQGQPVESLIFEGHDHFLMFSAGPEIFKAIDTWRAHYKL